MTQFTIVPNPRTAEDFARNWIAKTNDANSNLPYLTEMFERYGEIMYDLGYDQGYDEGYSESSLDLDEEDIDFHDNTT